MTDFQKKSQEESRSLAPLYILLVTLPLGISIQNAAAGIVFLWLVGMLSREMVSGKTGGVKSLDPSIKMMTLFALGMLVWITFATWFNDSNAGASVSKLLGGYLGWALMPLLLKAHYRSLTSEQLRKIFLVLVGVSLFWGTAALLQGTLGWKFVGMKFISEELELRARGLYSHPLSFAYAALLLWPVALKGVFRHSELCPIGFFLLA